MLLVRTPFRVSFFGGGTDYHEYFSEYGGSVLSTAIDKYCYVTLRNMPSLFSYRNQLTYSKIERFNSPDELEHPLVREALKYIPTDRIQIAYDADLPACSGLGSSSAFAVGLLQGLHALKDEYPDSMTLAKEAIHLERTLCNEAGGVQDQLATAFGGLNRIDMNADGYTVTPVKLSEERLKTLSESFMMIFTGFTRHSGEVASMQKKAVSSTLSQLHEMKALVPVAESILKEGSADDFGRLLNHTWQLKKSLTNQISNTEIDDIYEKALKNGALGGKLLGAGGGGFMLLYVPKEKKENIYRTFENMEFVSFDFDNSGSRIINQTKS